MKKMILLFVVLFTCSVKAQDFTEHEAKRANIKTIKNDSLFRVASFDLLKSKEEIELTKTLPKKPSGGAYYLTHYIGDGAGYENRFRPYLSDGISGWSSIDLREATKGNDVIVWYSVIIIDPELILLGHSKDDTISQATRDSLDLKLGTLELKKVENVVAEILLKNFDVRTQINGDMVLKLEHTTIIPESEEDYLKWKNSILQ